MIEEVYLFFTYRLTCLTGVRKGTLTIQVCRKSHSFWLFCLKYKFSITALLYCRTECTSQLRPPDIMGTV